jgi:GT2 family glycosyltransferase
VIELSVIVVSWNTRELTCSCLEELDLALRGRGAPSCEVFVVDNGSSDGSADAIRASFPQVRLIELPCNRGFAAGNNAALVHASGRVVLLLNSDARMTAAALKSCLAAFTEATDVAMVGPQLVHEDGRLQNSVHAFPSALTELVHTALLEWLLPGRFPSKRFPHRTALEVEALLGAALFVRRAAIEAVGPLCEGYFFFLEETDWCWRMRAAGWRVLFVPGARVVHISGASSKRRHGGLARIEFHRSLYRFLRVHRGPATLWLSVSLRVARGILAVAVLGPLGIASERQRRRSRERWQLLVWHLRGCPAHVGLAQVEGTGQPENEFTVNGHPAKGVRLLEKEASRAGQGLGAGEENQ